MAWVSLAEACGDTQWYVGLVVLWSKNTPASNALAVTNAVVGVVVVIRYLLKCPSLPTWAWLLLGYA